MLSQEEQISLFIASINKNALKERRAIEKQTQKLLDTEIKKIEEAVKQEAEKQTAYGKKLADADFNRKAGAVRDGYRRQLAGERAKLVEGLFENIELRLEEFCLTAEYGDCLKGKLAAIASLCPGEKPVIFGREKDLEIIKAAAKEIFDDFETREDKAIKTGGVKVLFEKENKLYDDTFDCALEEERKNYVDSSRLIIDF